METNAKSSKKVKRLSRNELIAQRERTKLLHKYNKEVRKEKKKDLKINSSSLKLSTPAPKPFLNSHKKAQIEYEAKLKEKQQQLEEEQKKKMEKEAALTAYKKNRKQKYRGLCKKSGSGQILMGKQVDALLQKIQKN